MLCNEATIADIVDVRNDRVIGRRRVLRVPEQVINVRFIGIVKCRDNVCPVGRPGDACCLDVLVWWSAVSSDETPSRFPDMPLVFASRGDVGAIR